MNFENGLAWLSKLWKWERLLGHVVGAIGAKYVITLSCKWNFLFLYLSCMLSFIVCLNFIWHLLLLLAEKGTQHGHYAFFAFKCSAFIWECMRVVKGNFKL